MKSKVLEPPSQSRLALKLLGLDLNTLLSDEQSLQLLRATLPFLVLLLVGTFLILCYSLQFFLTGWAIVLAVFGSIATAAGAAVLTGGLLGFLFGIPRTLDSEISDANTNSASNFKPENQSNGGGIRANTNLEQISDWLTKILVGAGLTQIGGIIRAIDQFANRLAPGFGNPVSEASSVSGKSFTIVVLIYYTVCGFFLGFLWARLYLPSKFRDVDLREMREELEKVNRRVDADSEARAKAKRQLSTKYPPIPVNELAKLFGQVSGQTRLDIFSDAQAIRSVNWEVDKHKVERTIPIFEALVKSSSQPYHRYYAELGFAYKDQSEPDWEEAEKALMQAIELRGNWVEHGKWTTNYEFNHALCTIVLDPEFQAGRESSPHIRRKIAKELAVAIEGGTLNRHKCKSSKILPWLKLNRQSIENPTLKQWMEQQPLDFDTNPSVEER